MEYLLIILSAGFLLAGCIGSLLPVLPGPLLSYLGLLILQFTTPTPFTVGFLLTWGGIVAALMILDNLIPAYATHLFGGSPYGITGSIVGLAAGVIFAPAGLVVGPLLGAFLGELLGGNRPKQAMRSSLGALAGFFGSWLLKLIAVAMMAYYGLTAF